jgi:hypothetical protein
MNLHRHKHTVKNMTTADWDNVEVPNQPPAIRTPKTYDAIAVADWCYVVSLKRFVWMTDPMREGYEAGQFNDLFAHIEMPTKRVNNNEVALTPVEYIKELHRDDRVFAKVDMLTDITSKVGYDDAGLKVLNIFEHPPAPPSTYNNDPTTMLEFLDYLFDGDKQSIEHIHNWIAHFLFKPETRLNHGIILSGNQGTGKTTLGEIVKKLSGKSGKTITPEEMNGNFQDWMKSSRLIVVEEVYQQDDYSFYNKIKPYLTNETNRVNPKGFTPFDIKNILNFMMFSNHQNPISIDKDDRRFFYYHSKAERKDKDYYATLYDYLFEQNGIYAYREFLEKNYLPALSKSFAFAPPPQTEAHIMAGEASVTDLEEYLRQQLAEGEGFYAPNRIFLLTDFKKSLKGKDLNFNILKNNPKANAVLQQVGLNHKPVTSKTLWDDTRKVTMAWWSHSDTYIREIIVDTSNEGREKLKDAYLGGKELNPFMDSDHG